MFKERFRQLLTIKERPHRIAAAFSVGVFIGMSPLLGIHTLLGLGVAHLLRLNKLVTILGVYVTNPWTIVPIYTFGTWVGARLLGVEMITGIDWANITWRALFTQFEHLLIPFVVGTSLCGTVSAVVSYFIVIEAVRRARG